MDKEGNCILLCISNCNAVNGECSCLGLSPAQPV